MTAYPKLPPIISSAIRNLPKREAISCTLALFGCRENSEHTILAHLRGNWALGMAQKPHDFFGLYLCDRCHDIVDGRSRHTEQPSGWEVLNALYCSQQIMALHDLLQVK